MKSTPDAAYEEQWSALVKAFHSFADVPTDRHTQTRFESLLDAMFACAAVQGRTALRTLVAFLSPHVERLPPIRIWIVLAQFYVARLQTEQKATLAMLDTLLEGAPPRTQWLVGTEIARLMWRREGIYAACQRVHGLEVFAGEEQWQYESPLVLSAVLTTQALAIASGDTAMRDRMVALANMLWPDNHIARLRSTLLLVDQRIAQGHFQDALEMLAKIRSAVQGDVRTHWLCARFHALVASGQGQSRKTRRAYRALRAAMRTDSSPEFALPNDMRRECKERAAQVARTAGLSKAAPRTISTLSRLLRKEWEARRIKNANRRHAALEKVISRAETLLLRPSKQRHPEETIRLKLLWCRVVVDLGNVNVFDACETVLAEVIDAAARLDFTQLQMLAWDQRAVMRARASPPDWRGALLDSMQGAALALELLSVNAHIGHHDHAQRALLASLLPVLDRAMDLHAEGAWRITQGTPSLLTQPLGDIKILLDEESPEGAFLRFGRVIHTFAEQSQALALAEARSAQVDGYLVPHRFAVSTNGEARIVVDAFAQDMRSDAAVLQYFVFGRYILIFIFGRDFFDWHLSMLTNDKETEAARVTLEHVLRDLRGWLLGESNEDYAQAHAQLLEWIWPRKLELVLRGQKIRHVCIVPHDILYRVPFGRLETDHRPLLQQYSLSLHPTGQLAAASATAATRKRFSRPHMGFVSGPKVDCLAQEESALVAALGKWLPWARMRPVDGAHLPAKTIVESLPNFDMLHFLCHGDEGGVAQSPALQLGGDGDGRVELRHFIRVPLHRCALVVLQSCWTGWMDHRRDKPVQGFPQAFCDAGAGAVIAPLRSIPQAITPLFSEVLYRTLSFLPAEKALQRTLYVLRTYGHVLLARSGQSLAPGEECPMIDALEYRYTGMTGILLGNVLSRGVGRLSFWWWQYGLYRKAKHC